MARSPILPIRIDDATKARWQAAATDAGESLASFVKDAVEAAISAPPGRKAPRAKKPARPTYAGGPRRGGCPRERFHRPGTFCKECGRIPLAA